MVTGHEHRWRENLPGRAPLSVQDLYASRELVAFLAWRDVRVRYKQAVFGMGWAVMQPLLGAAVLTLVFQRFVGLEGDGTPYLVFGLAGYALWTYVSSAVNAARTSVLANAPLVTRVPFPRIALPLAAVLPPLLDLAVVFPVVVMVAGINGVAPGPELMVAPLFVVATAGVALGIGGLFGSLSVLFRDVHHVFTFGIQLWLFASPVAYPDSLVEGWLRWVYALNPLVGLLEAWRWSVAGGPAPGAELGVSTVSAVVVLGAGIFVFQRVEHLFPDVI